MMDHCNPVVHINDKATFSESLQEQLYLDNVLKEFFHLQLLEQQEQQTGIDHQLCSRLDEIHVLTPHSDVLEKNKSLEAELCQCRSELEATIKENVELQNLLHNLKEENDFRVHEKETLLRDLADSKAAIASLEQDVADLNMNIRSVTEECDKMEGLEKRLNEEIRKLSAELVIFQDEKSVHNQQQSQLNANLKETMSHIEQLVEENTILQSKLEIHKAKLAEVAGQVVDPSSQVGTRSKRHDSTVDIDSSVSISATDHTEASVSFSGSTSDDSFESNGRIQLRSDLHDSASAVAGMKGYLEEAQKMLQSLEKAMDEMHAPKATAAAAGISKLIQSFESKSLADGHGSEGAPSSGSLYTSSKVQFGQLRVVLETLTQNNAHASALIMKEKDIYNGAIAVHEELEAEIESLKGFNSKLELRNIELEVLWGAMKQYLHNIEAKKAQLFDALQGQEVQLNELRGIAGEVASVVSNEVETLQKEMKEGIHAVERRWKSLVAELALMVEKLDAIAASAGSYPHHIENSHNFDVFDHFSLSLNYACEVIEQLKARLDVTGKDHETLSNSYMEVKGKFHGLNEKHNLAIVLLQKFFNILVHFLHVSGNDLGIDHIQNKESNPLEPLDPSNYEALLEKSDCLLDDFVQLKESNGKLYSDLLNRTNEIEELKKKIVDKDALLKIIMDVKDVLKLHDTVIDLDEVPIVQLQSFVLFLIERYKEVEEQANKSSNNFNCRMDELQGHVEWLEFFNFQQQNEVVVLRESLTQAKDALDATYVELLDKTKAFEQSEQRIASIREKLSIAVAKGKGLVVQRDSLKHSLSEMSTELEKSLQELRLKESKLHEVGERLKSYSEAGERMEALESELSYIRNSATALRESFLMKDNTLLKIEEILEDLELPEQFHTKDITEKVDWLAKAVAGNSLPPADWDQRSSVGGGSYSDAGFLTDGFKEDTQSTSNPDDDLKRKCDELQTKLYEMAEQNEILEQSLMDRNILVQRWEEILDRIHTPPQIRSMEPVERIHWLGTAVSEADNHMRSLQKEVESLENYCRSLEGDLEESQRIMSKHESSFHIILLEKESALTEAEDFLKSLKEKHIDLENYCESLSADLEESRRKITELESLLRDVIQDKESFANDVVSLSSDRDRVLDTVAQYEQEVDRLGKEVNSLKPLKEKHINLENYCESLSADLEESRRKITQLESLLRDAIHDKETFANDVVSLSSDRDRVLDTVAQYEQEVDRLGKEVNSLKTLKEKHIDLENYCESLSTDLAESQRKITELESLLRGAIHDKETFANDVVSLSSDRDRVLDTVTQYEGEVNRLGKEVDSLKTLKEKHIDLENYCESLSTDVVESRRKIAELESLLRDAIRDKETFANDVVSLSSERDRVLDTVAQYEGEVDRLGKEVDSLKTLKEKHIDLENYCESLSTDLAESRRKITELESSLRDAIRDKETFANDVVSLSSERDRVLDTVAQYEREVDRLGKEVDTLQKQKLKNEDQIQWIESEMKRLQHLILDVLPISDTDNVLSYENNIQDLEMLMRRLIIHIKDIDAESREPNKAVQEQPLLLVKDVETHHSSDKPDSDINDHISRSPISELPDVADVSKQLSSSLDEIKNLREERDVYMQNNQLLASEVEILKRKFMEVEELLKQEEQKSASLREKLNLAVRKGKSLVQQRDSLKQNIEEMTTENDQFKSKINNQEHALLESSQKISDLSLLLEHYKAFETENMSLKSRLMEAEPRLEQISHTLNVLLSKLSEIDAGDEINAHDPLQKLDRIGTLCSDLNAKAASFQQEASKSKKAAELLLAELNEVQERNDDLQEEIARAYDVVSNVSKERDLAESAKAEALSHLAKLSEERKEFEKLKSNVHEVKKGFFEISALIGDLFAKNKEHLQNLSSHVESCLEHSGVELAGTKDSDGLVSMNSRFKDFWSRNLLWDDKFPNHLGENVGLDICMDVRLHFQQLAEAIGGVRDTVHSYSISLDKETEVLTTMINTLLKSIISRKDSFESMKGLCTSLKSTVEEKDMEVSVLHKSICFLYDACLGSITEIERRKSQLVGETSTGRDLRVNLPADGVTCSGAALSSSENCVKTLAEELLLAVKDYVNIVTETVEGRSNEMRSTIFNLQKELQEKDIQREQICMELVSQIKEAETSASNYARELQSMKSYAQELESKLETMGKKQTLLEQQVEELLHGHSSSMELEEKVNSLHGVVAAKDQEIEVLMQALDEEENQMETLRSRVDELQKLVEKKSIDLERVEASRAKAVKKLAVTVSKFDELHHMSEGLLSEVENLQGQLQDRDAQISFLRKEVTRCTNDVLEATKKVKERNSGEFLEFLKWLDAVLSNVGMRDAHVCFDGAIHDHDEFKEHMQKDIVAIMSELGDLRVAAQRKDALLQAERSKVEDLSRRKEELEVSLRQKELHVKSLHDSGDIELESSEIVEVEPVLNKWSVPVNTSGSQVRSLRKVNNDQVSIAIDTGADNSGRFEDDEDDKVHGFKSLTTSRFVPKFTRPVSDMIDGVWVSCDRALMRQPAFRLGIMIYWAVLHALLASLVV